MGWGEGGAGSDPWVTLNPHLSNRSKWTWSRAWPALAAPWVPRGRPGCHVGVSALEAPPAQWGHGGSCSPRPSHVLHAGGVTPHLLGPLARLARSHPAIPRSLHSGQPGQEPFLLSALGSHMSLLPLTALSSHHSGLSALMGSGGLSGCLRSCQIPSPSMSASVPMKCDVRQPMASKFFQQPRPAL